MQQYGMKLAGGIKDAACKHTRSCVQVTVIAP